MKVGNFDVTSTSQRTYLEVNSSVTTMSFAKLEPVAIGTIEPVKPEEIDEVNISDECAEYIKDAGEKPEKSARSGSVKGVTLGHRDPEDALELKIKMLEMMIEKLTGKKYKFQRVEAPTIQNKTSEQGEDSIEQLENIAQNAQAPRLQARFRQTINVEQFHYESEKLSYNAQGIVNTADGRTINFDISMSMSREFSSYSSMSVEMEGVFCDPLVINYAGTAASLDGESFHFDLDMDGQSESIAGLGEGSGFLALDKNGDGQINDGGELFGPQSGNGFDDLRAYDKDNNGWIDENDEIFSKLRVWCKDKDGNDQLFTLLELDVGAIYLGDIETEFTLKDSNNNSQGAMRSTGFFLKESGTGGGTISHVDLVI